MANDKDNVNKQLHEMTRSNMGKVAFLLEFIEQQGLTAQLSEQLAQAEPDYRNVPTDLKARFLRDVDTLMSDASEMAQRRAENVVNMGVIDLSEHYTTSSTDFTLARHFMSALSKEIDYQFKPINVTKAGDALIKCIRANI